MRGLGIASSYGWDDEAPDNASLDRLSSAIHAAHVSWAPDGDEAFDDRSRVLHFDKGEHVRLIGWKAGRVAGQNVNMEHVQVELDATAFYGILAEWRRKFWSQWECAKKW